MNSRLSASGLFSRSSSCSTSSDSTEVIIDMDQSSLAKLSPEIICHIMCQQDIGSLLNLSQASKRFNDIYKNHIVIHGQQDDINEIALRLGIFKANEYQNRLSSSSKLANKYLKPLLLAGSLFLITGISITCYLYRDTFNRTTEDEAHLLPLLGALLISVTPGASLIAFALIANCIEEDKERRLKEILQEKELFKSELKPRLK